MVRIIMHGCNGHMGQVITGIVKEDKDAEIVAGIDLVDNRDNGYPVFKSLKDCDVEADVVIDFASAKAEDALIDACLEKKLPLVVCTTGLLKLLQDAAKVLAPAGFDMEIVEKHHKHKLDAPSGTAIAMADSINEAMGNEYTYTYDRSGRRQERDPKEIGISAVRGGNIVGEHEVIFAGLDEVIEFKHTAYSKAVFAKGAVSAAKFLKGKGPGYYDMSDVIKANA